MHVMTIVLFEGGTYFALGISFCSILRLTGKCSDTILVLELENGTSAILQVHFSLAFIALDDVIVALETGLQGLLAFDEIQFINKALN